MHFSHVKRHSQALFSSWLEVEEHETGPLLKIGTRNFTRPLAHMALVKAGARPGPLSRIYGSQLIHLYVEVEINICCIKISLLHPHDLGNSCKGQVLVSFP